METRFTTQPPWLFLPCCIGLLILITNSFNFLRWVFITFLRSPKDLKKYGSWALVTGATDGIGKAFVHQLAQHGLNLILVGRDQTKLKKVSVEIQSRWPNVKTKMVVVDFARIDNQRGFEEIEEMVKGEEVGVVINNVGITYPNAMYFDEVEEKVWEEIVRVNVEGTTRVIRAVLPPMIQRKRGAIVCIGSGASIVVPSHPLYTIYAATKGYIDQLSRSLYVEYKEYGIDVQCQVPLYVATKMTSKIASIEKTSLFVPSPEDYVRAAMSRIGYQQPRCMPYWPHSLQWFFASLVPHHVLDAWRLSIGLNRKQSSTL